VQLAQMTEAPAAQLPPSSSPYRTKKIEDVQAGEWVWSCDPVSGQWSRAQVVRPLVHDYAGDVVTVSAGGERIEATGNHPFWVVSGEGLSVRPDPHDVPSAERDALRESTSGRWVEARSLQAGDLLLLRSGATATVEELYSRQVEQKVYNLEVAGLHTYAVGGDGVLVHNKAMAAVAGPTSPRMQLAFGFRDNPLTKSTGALARFTKRVERLTGIPTDNFLSPGFPATGRGLVPDKVWLSDAMEITDSIAFNLDGISQAKIARYVDWGRGWSPDAPMTFRELAHIIDNPHLLNKTTFYRTVNGQQIKNVGMGMP
jgi:hypothetical protein